MTTYLKTLSAAFAASILWCSTASAHVYWQDSFESGDFTGWSFAQGADPTQGGPGPQYCYVSTYSAAGIPARDGEYIAHFQVPSTNPTANQAKVYKEWSDTGKHDQWGHTESKYFNGPDLSAVYIAWYYFPTNYTVSSTNWVNIFQFKEEGYITKTSATDVQNPSWFINVAPQKSFANGNVALETNTPVLFVNNWGNNYINYHPVTMPVPLGRWFEIRAKLYQGDRIEWWVNGHLLDTSYNSTWPVGKYYYQTKSWVFGVGHYQGIGEIYVDHAQVIDDFTSD